MHPHYDLIMLWAKNPRDMQVEVWDDVQDQWVEIRHPSWRPDRKYRVDLKQEHYSTLGALVDGQRYRYTNTGPVFTRFSIPAEMYGNPRGNKFDRSFGVTQEHQLDACRNPNERVIIVA